MDQIISKSKSNIDRNEFHSNLITEYILKNPNVLEKDIEFLEGASTTIIYQNRRLVPILIDRNRLNCYSIDRSFEFEFSHGSKGGSKLGYCKIRLSPYKNENCILITDKISTGEKFRSKLAEYKTNDAAFQSLKHYEILYYQYLAETIISFCDKFKLIEIEWEIVDLNHHIVDTNPNKYSSYLKLELEKMFKEGKFNKIDNSV